ncbi:type II toxin-antitoxin system VapC family toxin [Emticicia sp. SJ17W-69]|uniref:type II toxin-antitoxin system VapC family toxin n=1 Tax=Emticicia sp. SJ17W-69 TaxID=3421657 RepID=UPI003EC10561
MGKSYLIDTNVIVDAQMGNLSEKGLQLLRDIINENFTISFITYIEVLGYKEVSQTTEDFINLANVIEINKPIIDACISLRKQKNIKLPDAIIAATALVHGLTIISRNTKDFQNIKSLNCVNPHDL